MAAAQSTSETSGGAEPINGGPEKDKDKDAGSIRDEDGDKKIKKRKKKPINLHRGWPSPALLPAEALRAASQTVLSDPAIWAPGLEYGPDPGYQPLREALARWLGRFYRDVVPASGSIPRDGSGVSAGEARQKEDREIEAEEAEAEADRITITGGASQGLACLLQSFTDPARTLAVWVVAPCYFLACPIFADAGFAGRMRAAPEDDEGVDVEFLEREMEELEREDGGRERGGRGRGWEEKGERGEREVCGYKDPRPHRKIYRHVVYCVPAFSNPSGRTMTLARRKTLVALARRRDALVICDDVYDMLQWDVVDSSPSSSSSQSEASPPERQNLLHRALLPRVVDLDLAAGRSPHDPPGKRFGHVVSNGSFSKLVAPGTRTGWTYSTADFALGASQTGSTRSGGAASQLAATIICQPLLPPPSPSSSLRSKDGEYGVEEKEEEQEEEECELDKHIRHTLLPSYARRHALLTRAIRAELAPLGIRVREDSLRGLSERAVYGGYFVWMTLPGGPKAAKTSSSSTLSSSSNTNEGEEGGGREVGRGREGGGTKQWPTAQAIAARCRADEDLLIGNGELFAVHGDEDAARFDYAIRLCFAWEDEENLVEGVQRLGRVVRAMLEEGPGSWGVRDGENSDADPGK
ncbi:pyridoxal phosphate-dependent transferase [Nemania serpens]|nr:pyridoxal phosphate-dependent transferase [Nemania serpens]